LEALRVRHLFAAAVLQIAAGSAQACLFATSTSPEGWYEWARALFAGDVTQLAKDAAKPVDIITVRVVETFKGPEGANATLTVRISERHWTTCRTEKPSLGARVLVAMNANSDAMLVPLSAAFTEQLRAHKARQR
jgi:hypothetical protein